MNDLQMIRGDTARFKFQRLDNNGDPILSQADKIYFTVKTKFTKPNFVLQKTKADMTFDEEGYYHFTLAPSDTDKLGFHEYDFDIQVTDEGLKTTIAFGTLRITPEVTWAQNESED
jgi:hypothetical protein